MKGAIQVCRRFNTCLVCAASYIELHIPCARAGALVARTHTLPQRCGDRADRETDRETDRENESHPGAQTHTETDRDNKTYRDRKKESERTTTTRHSPLTRMFALTRGFWWGERTFES